MWAFCASNTPEQGNCDLPRRFTPVHTPARPKRIRSAGFFTRGSRTAVRLRKISGEVNVALHDARRLVPKILAGDAG